jgi:hypothetical protein
VCANAIVLEDLLASFEKHDLSAFLHKFANSTMNSVV